jgi:hypothetical protein
MVNKKIDSLQCIACSVISSTVVFYVQEMNIKASQV